MNFQVPRKLAPFLTKKKRYKIAIGGRGSGKSMTMADLLLYFSSQYCEKILCMREYQSSIEDSCLALLEEEINRVDIPGFNIGKTTISHEKGGLFRFKGLARSIDSIKSYHGFQKAFIEEAQFLSDTSLRIITPTFREKESEIWMAANPGSKSDPFSKEFLVPYWNDLLRDGFYEDDMHYIVLINHSDNPFFPAVLEQERLKDYERLPRALYDHIWEGHFNDHLDNAIISAEWFDSCIDAHEKLGFEAVGQEVVSHDPSDSGFDDKGLVHRHGSVIKEAKANKLSDVNDGMDWALDYAVRNKVDHFNWDADGMGLSLKRQVSDSLLNEDIDWSPFRGSGGVDFPNNPFEEVGKTVKDKTKRRTNKQSIKNRRAQYYWSLRNRVYNTHLALTKPEYRHQDPDTLISFSSKISELDQLRSEVCRIPRKPNPNGLIQILSKDEMRKLKIDSPNLADPTMMSLRLPMVKRRTDKIVYANPWRNN